MSLPQGYSTYEILGGATPDLSGGQGVLVKFRDVEALVKKQSAAGGIAMMVAPQTITATAYGQLRDKLAEGLRSQGVDADVSVISTLPSTAPVPKGELIAGMVAGAATVGVGWAVWHFFLKRIAGLVLHS